MDSQLDNLVNSRDKQLGEDMDVTAPSDLFASNDLADLNQLDQSDMDHQQLDEDNGNGFLEDSADDGIETDDDNINEDDATELEGTDSLNLLGNDLDDVTVDYTSGENIGKTEHSITTESDGVDDEETGQQDMEDNDTEQDDDEEDDTVEKTWDMAGDDADDDQANSSVDALLDAGDEDVYGDGDSKVADGSTETQIGNDGVVGDNTGFKEEDDQKTWNNDESNDTEAELEDQEETMEQGTVEESDNDRLGSTLKQALDALKEDQELVPTSPTVVDNTITENLSPLPDYSIPNDNDSLSLPPQQQEQQKTSTIGQDTTEDLATVDTSLLLLVALLMLVCLRLPYVKVREKGQTLHGNNYWHFSLFVSNLTLAILCQTIQNSR